MSDFDNTREDRYWDRLTLEENKWDESYNFLAIDFEYTCKKRDADAPAKFAREVGAKNGLTRYQLMHEIMLESLDFPESASSTKPPEMKEVMQLLLDVAYSGSDCSQVARSLITRMAETYAYYYAVSE